ncbi:hypothetical protein ACSBR2_006805 [Camellia fascicularis]
MHEFFFSPRNLYRSKAKLIEEIVVKIIPRENSSVDEGLVGMNYHIEEAIERLDLRKDDGCVVGIWGMGGIGKTTLARAVYDRISCQFNVKCFLENVRAVSKDHGIMYLQELLLHEISKRKDHKVSNVKSGKNMIKRIIGDRKVLIVLDDVDESIGVEDLLGKHDWFNSGSKIIITVEYCRGLPLALKVLGSSLHDREEIYWECTLKRLEKIPLSEVEEVLKISYNGLDEEDKDIFLHIAFCFNWEFIDAVTKILESLGLQPILGIKCLVEKSLINISLGQLIMHDLIQDCGRNIVRQESPKELGQHIHAKLALNRAPNDFGSPKELKLGAKAFQKLRKLKILKIHDVHLFEDLEYLPNELRYLDWDGYPSRCMPSKFQPMHLVELHMTQSNIKQLWMETEVLPNLKVLDLGYSKDLTMIPDFKKLPNLEELMLNDCPSLEAKFRSGSSIKVMGLPYACSCLQIEYPGQLRALLCKVWVCWLEDSNPRFGVTDALYALRG